MRINQSFGGRQTHIPQQIERAMNQKLQQTLPANLKQYVGADRPTFVPPKIQKQIDQQMQKNMPSYLKAYSGAYMQQNVIQPNIAPTASRPLAPRPPTPDPRRFDQSLAGGEQPSALWADLSKPTTMPSPASTSFQAQQPEQRPEGQYEVAPSLPAEQNDGHGGHNPYEFIVNPTPPKKHGPNLFGDNQFLKRIALIVGGALLFIVAITVILNLVVPSGSNKTELTALAQQQQEIVRVATLGAQLAKGDTAKNFAVSVQLSLQTSQQQTLDYLSEHGTSLKAKTLSLTKNPETDTLLTNAQATSTFDSVMEQTLVSQLSDYKGALKKAFDGTKNDTLKTLLNQNYQAAALLLQQGQAAQGQSTTN